MFCFKERFINIDKEKIAFLLILILAIFFRFYRLTDFQYWSVDEGILYLSARKIFLEHKPILLVPNTNMAISLGAFFAYISAFIFWVTNSNLILVLSIGSLLGIVTSLATYQAGKLLFNNRVGLIAFFLYSCSFLLALLDRRWWQLSLDSFLVILSLISLYKIISKQYFYSLLLALAASFGWHSDPSLLVISIATFFSFLLFRIPLFKRQYLPALFWLIISLSPFFIAESRHPGSISKPIGLYTNRILGRESLGFELPSLKDAKETGEKFTRSIFTTPSKRAEVHLFCLQDYPPSWLSPYSTIVTLFLFVLPGLWVLIRKEKKCQKTAILLYIFIISFLLSVFAFKILANVEVSQHYFLVVWPAFLLLVAWGLEILFRKKLDIFVYLFLLTILLLNFFSLLNSKMSYPVEKRLRVVDEAIAHMDPEPFALYYESRDFGFSVAGWDSLFLIRGRPSSWGQFTNIINWTHQAYSLHPIEPKKEEELTQKVRLFGPDITDLPEESDGIKRYKVEGVNIFIEQID